MPRTTYPGACHCGQITYTVTLDNALAPEGEGKMLVCNCSICTKNGYLLVYPKREDVVFASGCEDKMSSYKMGKANKLHRFCPACSSSILIDWKDSDVIAQRAYLAMNARLFEGVDLGKALFDFYDGFSGIEPKYERGLAKRSQGEGEGKGEM